MMITINFKAFKEVLKICFKEKGEDVSINDIISIINIFKINGDFTYNDTISCSDDYKSEIELDNILINLSDISDYLDKYVNYLGCKLDYDRVLHFLTKPKMNKKQLVIKTEEKKDFAEVVRKGSIDNTSISSIKFKKSSPKYKKRIVNNIQELAIEMSKSSESKAFCHYLAKYCPHNNCGRIHTKSLNVFCTNYSIDEEERIECECIEKNNDSSCERIKSYTPCYANKDCNFIHIHEIDYLINIEQYNLDQLSKMPICKYPNYNYQKK